MPSPPPPGRYPWPSSNVLPASALAFFHTHGYVVLTSHLPPPLLPVLRAAGVSCATSPSATPPPLADSIFTTAPSAQARPRSTSDWFLSSAGRVSAFREASPAAPPGVRGVNKVGHALHDLVPAFALWSYGAAVRGVARGVAPGARAAVVQSMFIMKGARVGGAVRPHRDGTFVLAAGTGCTGLWWALQDATRANGCLWVVPGSQVDGVGRRMVRRGGGTAFEGEEGRVYERAEYVPLEMQAGDCLVLHAAVVHMSEENVSEKSRYAYSIHLVSDLDDYSPEGWLQRGPECEAGVFRTLSNPPAVALEG